MKQTLYPKTQRISKSKILLTEKLDGSNLGLFKFNNTLVIVQRNNIFTLEELDQVTYKGLKQWLSEYSKELLADLHDGSGVFGEWIGMGQINYQNRLSKKLYIFAKANITFNAESGFYEVWKINYNPELFIYPFQSQQIPDCMGIVPIINEEITNINKEELDKIYDTYCKHQDGKVEGFIVNNNDSIHKYVRLKDGKFEEHHE